MRGVIVAAILTLSTAMAWPHDAPSGNTYPQACCSPDDQSQLCHPIDCDEIGEDEHGRYRWQNLTFAREKVFSSFDDQCHACHSYDWQDGQKHPSYGYCLMIRNSVDKGAAIKWTAMYNYWGRGAK